MGQVLLFERTFPRRRPGPRLADILRGSVARMSLGKPPRPPAFAAEEREGTAPATAPTATPQNAKGARHCCQAPCRRTAAVDPDGSSAWFRRLLRSRRQGHASFGSVVEAGRSPLTPRGSCGYQPRRPASSLRPGAGSRKPCWMLFSARSFQILPHRLRAASGWPISRRSVSPFPKPGTCAPISANRDIVPFHLALLASNRTCVPLSASASSCAFALPSASFLASLARRGPLSLRTSLARHAPLSGRAVLRRPSKPRQRLGGTSVSQPAGTSHPRTVPDAVSRRHLHRFRSV